MIERITFKSKHAQILDLPYPNHVIFAKLCDLSDSIHSERDNNMYPIESLNILNEIKCLKHIILATAVVIMETF